MSQLSDKTKNLKIESISFWCENELCKGGMRIHWSSNDGFGTLDVVKTKGNDFDNPEEPFEELEIIADTEYMDSNEDKEFTREIMKLLVDKLTVV